MNHSHLECFHDYHLTGYSVDGDPATITFKLCWPYDSQVEVLKALLVFTQVEGYFFAHDLGGNIISEIAEMPLMPFIEDNSTYFSEEKRSNWPLFWRGTVEATALFLNERQARLWTIDSCYGLYGWIVAADKAVKIIERRDPHGI